MDIAIFVVSILVYFWSCLAVVKFHKHVSEKLKLVNRLTLINLCGQYIWFLLFIVTYIPFSIFFPAWLNAKLNIVQESQNMTTVFILSGCLTLAITMWLGYKKSKRVNW